MANDQRMHLLTQVAQMYYEQSTTQEAIASTFHLSRPTVSRLLKEAREEGIVQITIHSPFRRVAELEAALLGYFPHLRGVAAVRSTDSLSVARYAGAHIGSMVRNGDVIGVSWGNTMAEVSAHLPDKPCQSVTVVQLNGGVARAGAGTNAHDIASRFGKAFAADVYYLQLPAVVDNGQVREVLLRNSETARLLDIARRANIAVFGIGVPHSESVLVSAGYFTPQHVQELRHRGAVGDICSRYFTIEGAVADRDLDDRTIGVDLVDLARREHAIAVVHGVHKAVGVLAALRGGLMSVLIIDDATAREVLRLQQGGLTAHD